MAEWHEYLHFKSIKIKIWRSLIRIQGSFYMDFFRKLGVYDDSYKFVTISNFFSEKMKILMREPRERKMSKNRTPRIRRVALWENDKI